MNVETLLGDKLKTSIIKIRASSDIYEELVFLTENSSALHDILIKTLGAEIIKVSDSEMTKAAIKVAGENGGIDEDQFLYGGVVESKKIVVMIWPWQDNKHLTIKKYIV